MMIVESVFRSSRTRKGPIVQFVKEMKKVGKEPSQSRRLLALYIFCIILQSVFCNIDFSEDLNRNQNLYDENDESEEYKQNEPLNRLLVSGTLSILVF